MRRGGRGRETVPNRKSLPAFPALPKIYFHLSLLALMDVWDDLSRIFRDKGVQLPDVDKNGAFGICGLSTVKLAASCLELRVVIRRLRS